ncbi:hypothetical protein PR048_001732 [Dryococelus australis]|uniref:HAT C-terminal dimerisation domain-containing protein n=1 Tax=Dryococelus australis TaxID=614101 RepID=A0ABQ9II69_9NEOP|nr:hypothetical protein PR048_001732 [Dryococelus australis]
MESALLVDDATKDLREKTHMNFGIWHYCNKVGRKVGAQSQHFLEDYYRAAVYIPSVDNLILQLRERFLVHKKLLNSFIVLLPKLTTKPTADDEDSIKQFDNAYATDCSENHFPIVKTFLRVLASLPVITATDELSFSSLKRLK